MTTFSVGPAKARDCSECARLLVDQPDEHGIGASRERLARVLEDVVADASRGFLMLARESGEIVGIAYVVTIPSAEHSGPVAWLEELYVVPDSRCHGIGTALVTSVLERARHGGIVAVDLEIDAGHDRASSLYQRLGFRRLQRSRWVKRLESDAA
jgi:GNAT superfamily N-acetyltransferase